MMAPNGRHADWPFFAGLLLITLVCFWPVGQFGFIGYDDLDYVYQNAHVQAGLTWSSIVWAFSSADASNWHPLTWLSLMLDCEVFGTNPQEEHWVNLCFHAANTLLVFAFLRQLTGARWRSFFVAALFACHPTHVQSVAWISERKDVLSGFFGILTLMAYVRYARSKTKKDYAWVLVLFALGLMAKPMLVTLPVIMLLLDFWPLGRLPFLHSSFALLSSAKALLVEKIPLLVLCFASSLITLWAQNAGGAVISMQAIPLADRGVNTIISYVRYLEKLLWPEHLAIFYPFPRAEPDVWVWAGALLLLAALTLVCLWRRRAQPYLLMGWLWFVVMLLPVIGLVQVGTQSMADRYTYLPAIGIFIMVAWGLAEIASTGPKRWALASAITILVAACIADTRHQLGFWRNNITLFQHVVDVTPDNNFLGYFYLALSYAEKGDLPTAERCLRKSLEINPHMDLTRSRLGNVLYAEKKYAEAEVYFQQIVRAHPNEAYTHLTLGMDLAAQKKYETAQKEFQTALQFAPNNPTICDLLGKNTPQAEAMAIISRLTGQLATNNTPDMHMQIAEEQVLLENYPEAVKHYEKAVALNPDATDALNNLAWLLATCPDASIRNGPHAVQLAEHACELVHFNTTLFLGTLAAAQAEAGQFNEAIATAQKACASATAKGEADLLEHNQELLNLYQQHKAYHETADQTAR